MDKYISNQQIKAMMSLSENEENKGFKIRQSSN